MTMANREIKLIITDFDGTLVDTFEANLNAYQAAFESIGLKLTEEQYKACFGFRFEKFMDAVGIEDSAISHAIRTKKTEVYPGYFNLLKLNKPLHAFIQAFKWGGAKTAIASTARKENLLKVLNYLHIADSFDYIVAGEDVVSGKPNPEIFQNVMAYFGVQPENTLIFEDTEIGIQAAKASGANYIQITSGFYGN
jgi:beta-phosphoglucomutase